MPLHWGSRDQEILHDSLQNLLGGNERQVYAAVQPRLWATQINESKTILQWQPSDKLSLQVQVTEKHMRDSSLWSPIAGYPASHALVSSGLFPGIQQGAPNPGPSRTKGCQGIVPSLPPVRLGNTIPAAGYVMTLLILASALTQTTSSWRMAQSIRIVKQA